MKQQPFIYLAPLEGNTEIEFRNVFVRHFQAVDAAIAPFVSLNHHDSDEKRRGWNIPDVSFQLMPTIPQFMGRNIKDYFHLVQWITDKGYDEINWNLGCPVKRVVKKGRGCGQLRQPDEIRYFLDDAVPKTRLDFSIKTRLGMDSPDESYKLIELYNEYPLKKLIIHPRIGKQLYSGEVMLDYFEECLKNSKNTVVYNGDINSVADFKNIQNKFPSVERFMIGRGLLRDPFLAEKIKGLSPDTTEFDKNRFIQFHKELYTVFDNKLWNKEELLGKMKEYWRSFASLFENRNEVVKYIVRSKDLDEFHERVDEVIR